MHAHLNFVALCALLVPTPAAAQSRGVVPFPLEGPTDRLVLRPDLARELAARSRAIVAGVPLPGAVLDLAVERVEDPLVATAIHVDGSPTEAVVDPLASCWRGRVVGLAESDVFLGFSSQGSRGWIQAGGELWHLLALPGPDGSFSASVARFASEAELLAAGGRPFPGCEARVRPGAAPAPPPRGSGGSIAATTPQDTLVCRLAVETDFQLFQRFNDLGAETAYLNQLFAAASARFDQDLLVQLQVVHLGLHSNANDGWTSGDTGAGAGAMLDEFRNAWAGNIPAGAHLAHFVSGASLGGGVAWLNVLCSPSWGFAVSGDLGGNMPFPVMQGPLTWDFVVFTHELGHNFGTPHTHDFCPPLDTCAPQGYFGQCQTSQGCISDGTIMSYCHLCSGGMSNVALVFHPATAQLMRQYADASCLPVLCAAPTTYCGSSPNSYDPFGAYIAYYGSNRISQNDLGLLTSGVPPGTSAIYYYGQNATIAPFGNGFRCIGNPAVRLPIQQANLFGDVAYLVDYAALPAGGQISAGQTWHFQLWYRNPAGGGAGFNLSDGLRIQFCP